ncbi:MAG: hypothetical protein KJ626_05535 [Verrucomicrobia bacterium]|nr:hypothetical protein [Verrucomicrobiota bacterium]
MGNPVLKKPGPRPSIRHHTAQPPKGSRYIPVIVAVSVIALFLQIMWVEKNKDKFIDQSVVMMLKRAFRSQVFSIACPNCGGDGLVADESGNENAAMCPVCFGLGAHDVRIVENADVVCTQCGGLGRIADPDMHHAHACSNCGGRGVISQMPVDRKAMKPDLVRIECEECQGSGVVRNEETRHREICPICFGLGYHVTRRVGEDDSLCPACGGMGRLIDLDTGVPRTCRRCDGRGMIENDEPR